MKCLQHPPNSPNLNPVKNTWGHVMHLISKEYDYINSINAMMHVVISFWNEFEDHEWNHLIESMSNRVQAVIKANGGSTSY
jgi:uncharacterized protein YbgA (DUF1722 family)